MYKQELTLSSNCEIFKSLADEFNAALGALVMIANKDGREGELTLKLKVKTYTERRYDKEKVVAEWTEPLFSWDVTRKVKEGTNKMSGSGGHDFMLKFDEHGKPYIVEASPQITVAELLKHINGEAE